MQYVRSSSWCCPWRSSQWSNKCYFTLFDLLGQYINLNSQDTAASRKKVTIRVDLSTWSYLTLFSNSLHFFTILATTTTGKEKLCAWRVTVLVAKKLGIYLTGILTPHAGVCVLCVCVHSLVHTASSLPLITVWQSSVARMCLFEVCKEHTYYLLSGVEIGTYYFVKDGWERLDKKHSCNACRSSSSSVASQRTGRHSWPIHIIALQDVQQHLCIWWMANICTKA